MTKFNDTLYASGNGIGIELMRWNGTIWDTTGSFSVDGSIRSFCSYNNALYVAGTFNHIGGITANCIAKYNGVSWSAVSGFPFTYSYAIYSLEVYNGELYAGGNFGDSLGNTCNIARWDGSQWHYVGQGFHGGMDEVFCMETSQNKLFIAGAFKITDGNVGNYIAQWDGATLSDVGGGLWDNTNGQVWDLCSYHNNLYAAGFFTYAGGVWAQNVAKWDGVNWCGNSDTVYYPGVITCLGTLRDTLYIGGSFSEIDGDSISKIAKWTGGYFGDACGNTTGIENAEKPNFEVTVFPNPATTSATFQINGLHEMLVFTIYDQLGREVWSKQSEENEIEINTAEIAPGLYYYRIEESGEVKSSGKLIIE